MKVLARLYMNALNKIPQVAQIIPLRLNSERQIEVLLPKRIDQGSFPSHWGTFGGEVEGMESLVQAAIRELLEESGVAVLPEELHYLDNPLLGAPSKLKQFERYLFDGSDMAFHNAAPEEHSAVAWHTAQSIADDLDLLVIPDVRQLIKNISALDKRFDSVGQLIAEIQFRCHLKINLIECSHLGKSLLHG